MTYLASSSTERVAERETMTTSGKAHKFNKGGGINRTTTSSSNSTAETQTKCQPQSSHSICAL